MSRSPTGEEEVVAPEAGYLDAWGQLAQRIQEGRSFSGRERNCCFLNTRSERFADVSSAIGLDQIDDSRAVAVVDWDHDGDLDLWLANRTGPRVRFLRNDMPKSGQSMQFRLQGDPDLGVSRDAIGARVVLTGKGTGGKAWRRVQTLYAGDGFLSQSSKWLSFGVGSDEVIDSVAVRWPGRPEPETFRGVEVNSRHILRQGAGVAELADVARDVALKPSTIEPPPLSDRGRVRLSEPLPLSEIRYQDWLGQPVVKKPPFERPVLILLWASWCQPCVEEIKELTVAMSSGKVPCDVIAANVEGLDAGATPSAEELQRVLGQIGYEGTAGMASEELVTELNAVNTRAVYRKRALPLPSSVLADRGGWVRVIYKGSLDSDVLLADLHELRTTKEKGRDLAVPFPGRWGRDLFVTNPVAVASVEIEQGYPNEARDYLRKYLAENRPPSDDDQGDEATLQRLRLADVYYQLATAERAMGNYREAVNELQRAIHFSPGHLQARVDIAAILRAGRQYDDAYRFLTEAKEIAPSSAAIHSKLGVIRMQQGEMKDAIVHFTDALKADPASLQAANNLSWLLATTQDPALRDGEMAVLLAEKVCKASGFQQPQALDTYAAALAETGEFARAVKAASDAIAIGEKSPQTPAMNRLLRKLHERKALYEQGKPIRE